MRSVPLFTVLASKLKGEVYVDPQETTHQLRKQEEKEFKGTCLPWCTVMKHIHLPLSKWKKKNRQNPKNPTNPKQSWNLAMLTILFWDAFCMCDWRSLRSNCLHCAWTWVGDYRAFQSELSHMLSATWLISEDMEYHFFTVKEEVALIHVIYRAVCAFREYSRHLNCKAPFDCLH